MMSFFLFICAMYWLPTLIAVVRRTPSALAASPVPHVVYVERRY